MGLLVKLYISGGRLREFYLRHSEYLINLIILKFG